MSAPIMSTLEGSDPCGICGRPYHVHPGGTGHPVYAYDPDPAIDHEYASPQDLEFPAERCDICGKRYDDMTADPDCVGCGSYDRGRP